MTVVFLSFELERVSHLGKEALLLCSILVHLSLCDVGAIRLYYFGLGSVDTSPVRWPVCWAVIDYRTPFERLAEFDMRTSAVYFGIVFAGLLAIAPVSAQGTYGIRHVNVLPMSSAEILNNQTVLVDGGRITAIGPEGSIRIPDGAEVIHGRERYLMPGLAEMHAHVPGTSDQQYLEDVLFLYVANGITTARGMLGQPAHLRLRGRLASHELLGPRLITSGPSLNGRSVSSAAQAAQMVKAQSRAGYDFVKMHPGLTREEYDAAMAAGKEVGIRLAGHVSSAVGLSHALDSGQATIDHLDGYMAYLIGDELADDDTGVFGSSWTARVERERIVKAAAATKATDVWVVPTQAFVEHLMLPIPGLADRPEMSYMPKQTVDRWRRSKGQLLSSPEYSAESAKAFVSIRLELIKALHDVGAGILLGSDAPQVFNVPGFSIHAELSSYLEAGLTPFEVLSTGTVNPARFFSASDQFGAIEAGLAADLILSEDNPLEGLDTLRRPAGVMVRGVWLDRDALDRRLAEIAARQAGGATD